MIHVDIKKGNKKALKGLKSDLYITITIEKSCPLLWLMDEKKIGSSKKRQKNECGPNTFPVDVN